jgi:hypothetical protein
MKKSLTLLFWLLSITLSFSQAAKRPTIVVVPADNWMNNNGYIQRIDNQGKMVPVPDYRRALLENTELLLVIAKINQLMVDRNFPLNSLESAIKTLETEAAEESMLVSKAGTELRETAVEKLRRTVNADIWLQVNWKLNSMGPKKSIYFELQGIDPYTDKSIAGASGTGQPSFTSDLTVLLQEAVLMHLDNFNVQLQSHFDNIFADGREIKLNVRCFDVPDLDLETEYDGMELGEIIENWVSSNTVKGRFTTGNASENRYDFTQVRIPLFDSNGRALDGRGWARNLQKMLRDKYQIPSKLLSKGLGQVILVIGEK